MNTLRNAALALTSGLGIATLLAASLVSNSAAAVSRSCTVSSGTSPTGREWGEVYPSRKDPTTCLRRRIGGDAPPGFPSCHEVARQDLGCFTVIDVD
ncbi:MAG: hypothetical protein ACMG6S_00620 [Byssovorax sp.]